MRADAPTSKSAEVISLVYITGRCVLLGTSATAIYIMPVPPPRTKQGFISNKSRKAFCRSLFIAKAYHVREALPTKRNFNTATHHLFKVYVQKARKRNIVLFVVCIQTFTACLVLLQLRKLHRVFFIKWHLRLTCSDKIELW